MTDVIMIKRTKTDFTNTILMIVTNPQYKKTTPTSPPPDVIMTQESKYSKPYPIKIPPIL